MISTNMIFLFLVFAFLVDSTMSDCTGDTSQNYININIANVGTKSYRCGYAVNSFNKKSLCGFPSISKTCCQQCESETATDYDENTSNKLDTYFFIEPSAVQRFMNDKGMNKDAAKEELKKSVRYNIVHMNKMYESLEEYGLKIKLYYGGVTFTKTNFVDGTGGKVDKDSLLSKFKGDVAVKEKLKDFDLVMLYTGLDLTGANGFTGVAGIADIGKVCKIDGAPAIAEIRGTFGDVNVGAHEIGHALGAEHDTDACGDGYIMSSVTNPSQLNKWFFSKCSAQYFKEHIRKLTYNCMLVSPETSKGITAYSQDLGILKPKEVCHTLGDSYDFKPSGNQCQTIQCQKDRIVKVVPASDGMSCEISKICSRGKCIEDPEDTENLG